jgi:S1-C subfamily serine protease
MRGRTTETEGVLMDLLDLLLILAALGYAASGYRRGLVAGCISLAGFLGGAVIGVWLLPYALRPFMAGTFMAAVVALLAVLIPACIGHALASGLAWKVRQGLSWGPVRWIDGLGGAAAAVVALLAVAWLMASVLVTAPIPALSSQIRSSAVLGVVDRALPAQAPAWFSRANNALSGAGFPQVFNPFENEPVTSVPAPSDDSVTAASTAVAKRSVVKIEGVASVDGGERGQEGSGFVYAGQHVMTNAHVVAGVSHPTVQVGGVGRSLAAKVVLFDPETDIAVLDVPGLSAPSLKFAGTAQRGDPAVVAGYPQDGGLSLRAATFADRITAKGQDIYGDATTTRDVYQIRSDVQHGNSGGPLLSPDGRVYGVVFARSTADASTGYALTADQVASDAVEGTYATQSVDTGDRAAL